MEGIQIHLHVHVVARDVDEPELSSDVWLERLVGAANGDSGARLQREVFERAVRRALKCFHCADRLAKSPLMGTALVGARPTVSELRAVLRRACLSLGDAGGDARHVLLLRRSYLDEPKKQLAVAEELGMGFSTYRRHLGEAVRHVTQILWARDRSAVILSSLAG